MFRGLLQIAIFRVLLHLGHVEIFGMFPVLFRLSTDFKNIPSFTLFDEMFGMFRVLLQTKTD